MTTLYNIVGTDGNVKITLAPNQRDLEQSTDLTFMGPGTTQWGESVNQNIYNLLESFACAEALGGGPLTSSTLGSRNGINHPVVGQLWFNTTKGFLHVYDGSAWQAIGSQFAVTSGPSSPPTPNLGQLWYDTAVPQLKVYNGSSWVSVADRYTLKAGDTMTGYLTLHADPVNNMHAATKKYVDDGLSALSSSISASTSTNYYNKTQADAKFLRKDANDSTPFTLTAANFKIGGNSVWYGTTGGFFDPATKQNVLGYTPANDTAVMHLSGNETANGGKTFTGAMTIKNSLRVHNNGPTANLYFGTGSTQMSFSGTTLSLTNSNFNVPNGVIWASGYEVLTNTGYSASTNDPNSNVATPSGYQIFSSGLKIAWGAVTVTSATDFVINLPINYTGVGTYMIMHSRRANTSQTATSQATNFTNNQMRVSVHDASGNYSTGQVYWMTMGY